MTKFTRLIGLGIAGLALAWSLYSSRRALCKGIFRLPDDVLCNIISRLNAIEAARTSILSKRWRKIRGLEPQIRFDCFRSLSAEYFHEDLSDEDQQRFFGIVDQRLALYTGQKLKKFAVRCCFLSGHSYRLTKWLSDLAKLDVEEISLGRDCQTVVHEQMDRTITFSFVLIGSLSKLIHLELSHCCVETSFAGQCNSLARLTLLSVPLPDQNLSNILLACPNITKLEISCCELPRDVTISGPSLKLKNILLSHCHGVERVELQDLDIATIDIFFSMEVQILLSHVPRLNSLRVVTPTRNFSFGDLPQLKVLLIQTVLQNPLPPTFQVFGNIRVLSLLMRRRFAARIELNLRICTPVLSGCPFLQEFYLAVGGRICKDKGGVPWPVVQHEHLTHMELSGFSNTQNELEFAKFILTSAKVLKSLVLGLYCREYHKDRGFDFTAEMELEERYAESLCARLQGHAISKLARVQVLGTYSKL